MEQYIMQLKRIIYTLGQVEVKGKNNLDGLLASIQSLEQMQNVMETELREQKKAEVKARAAENE